MFNWNPFARDTPTPAAQTSAPSQTEATTQTSDLPENHVLIEAIQHARLDTLMGDVRPLHRAILQAELLVPLYEESRPTSDGRQSGIKPRTLNEGRILPAFTDAATMKSFYLAAGETEGVHVHFLLGQQVCALGEQGGFEQVIINPDADVAYYMPPLVFRALATGHVLAGMSARQQEEEDGGLIMVGACPAGLPPDKALSALTLELARSSHTVGGASEAFWYGTIKPPNELSLSLGVACAPELFPELSSALGGAWLLNWPINTPLLLHRLKDDALSQAIRDKGEPIFRAAPGG